jgi:hypothetical protein
VQVHEAGVRVPGGAHEGVSEGPHHPTRHAPGYWLGTVVPGRQGASDMSKQDNDTYVRTNAKKRQGFARKGEPGHVRNLYPPDPAARRRLNSVVNERWQTQKESE